MCAVYWNWSLENAGGVMMFAAHAALLLAGRLLLLVESTHEGASRGRPQRHPGPGAGVVGAFPGTSIWPFTLGMGAFFVVLALVFGIWFLVPGLGLVVWAMLGGTAEGRRGGKV